MCSLLIIMNWTLMTVLTVLCCSTCLIFEHLLFPSASVLLLGCVPYDYTVEVINRFKGLDLIDRVPDELWREVRDIV